MAADEPGQPCPAVVLLAGRPVGSNVELLELGRSALTSGSKPRAEVLSALVHMLDHGTPNRPAIAATIADLAPEVSAETAAILLGYREDHASDPTWVDGAWEDYHAISLVLSLATLDATHLPEAAALFQTADHPTALHFAPDLARLGPQGASAVVEKLCVLMQKCDRWSATDVAWALLTHGSAEPARVRAALDDVVARSVPVGLAGKQLSSLPADFVPYAVSLVLASLELEPRLYLGEESGHGDIPAAVLEAGPQYAPQLARVLWQIVESRTLDQPSRMKAAQRLGLISADEQVRAEDLVLGPAEAKPQNSDDAAARAGVAHVWQRIHDHLREHESEIYAALPGPASEHEIAVAEAALGVAFSADFAASLAIHRAGELGALGRQAGLTHPDVSELAQVRDEVFTEAFAVSEAPVAEIRWDEPWRPGWIPLDLAPDGALLVLDLDPGPTGTFGQITYAENGGGPPDRVEHPSWLGLLEDFMSGLEVNRP